MQAHHRSISKPLILLALVFSSNTFAWDTGPTCKSKNWNCIYLIHGTEKYLVFSTSQGEKKYNVTNGLWKYELSHESLDKLNKKVFDKTTSIDRRVPKIFHTQYWEHPKVIAISKYKDAEYLLFQEYNEESGSSRVKIADLKNSVTYQLPYRLQRPYRAIYVTKNFIWLGSSTGITRINKKTEDRSLFSTLSEKSNVKYPIQIMDSVYFISNHGLTSINQDGSRYTFYSKINQKYIVNKLFKYQNWLLIFGIDRESKRWGDLSLLTFNINTNLEVNLKNNKNYTIESEFSDHIDTLFVVNNYLYGLGHKEYPVEGGQYNHYGSLFRYSFINDKIEQIVTKPVGFIDLKNKIAVSRSNELDDGSITLKIYNLKNKWPLDKPSETYYVYKRLPSNSKLAGKIYKIVKEDRWSNEKRVEVHVKKDVDHILYLTNAVHNKRVSNSGLISKIKTALGKDIRTIRADR